MNFAILLAAAAVVTELVVTVLLWTLGGVQGFRRARFFVGFALAAALFSLTNLASVIPGTSPVLVSWAGRAGGLSASIAAVCWLCYARVRGGLPPLAGVDRGIAYAGLGAGLLCLIPGVIYVDGVLAVPVNWLGVTYRIVTPTGLAGLAYLALLAPLAASARHLWRQGPRLGRALHGAALVVLLVTAVNDSLVSMGALQSPYLVELSFALMMLAVGHELTETIAAHARRLDELTTNQRAEIEARTEELVEVKRRALRNEQLAGLGRLAAGVGHEINNPLTYLQSSLEFIAETWAPSPDDAALREALADAQDGVQRIAGVVRDLRIMTPSKHAQQHAELGPALERAQALTSHIVAPRVAALDIDVPPDVFVGIGDEPLVRIIGNLLVNAAQATVPDRPNTLSLKVQTESPEVVTIAVSDTGRGIAAEHLDKIFEPFYSGRFGEGMGLGLAITNTLVANVGGQIQVQSTAGVGTTFRLLLPRVPAVDDAHEAAAEASGEPMTKPRRRLVVVDDETLVARALGRLLADDEVEVFIDPLAARDRLLDRKAPPVDVVLCDLHMSPCSGPELRQQVEQVDERLAARFVFITGGATDQADQDFLADPKTRWIAKPFDHQKLRETIEDVAAERSLEHVAA